MALNSWIKSISDRVAYYSNWKFNFQKTRVIGSLYYLDEALERYAAAPFHVKITKDKLFYLEHGHPELNHRWYLFHEEALFLNYVVDNWKFDKSNLSKYELQDYEEAVEKLKKWNDIRVFCGKMDKFIGEIKRTIYIRRASNYPNNFYSSYFPELEISIVSRYHALVDQLKDYPEWKEKVAKEVEPIIKQLADASPLSTLDSPVNIFYGIDMQSYFK